MFEDLAKKLITSYTSIKDLKCGYLKGYMLVLGDILGYHGK
jgi:hypothetical protein